MEHLTLELINSVVKQVKSRTSQSPRIGMILGSGLGPLADEVENADKIPYSEIEGWPVSTVQGHVGQLVIGQFEGQDVLVMQGRSHFYEGYHITLTGLPIRVMQKLGIEILIVTNAAGAIHPDFVPGDLMLITDHINFIGMAGHNPLMGPNIEEFGPRFPDMSQIYDRKLGALAREVNNENDLGMQEGVYVGLSGPSFETPAELRFLRTIGADAVGMSTVMEATVARHGGTRILGISGISNKANLDGNTITTHEEVLEAGEVLVPKLETLVRGVLRKL